jgi:steroid delta-isomerase-like uncharacterized protein
VTDVFDVSVYLIACARDCLDEPPLFGPRRMVEATARLTTVAPDDPALHRLAAQIEERRGALLGMDRDAFAVWLDGVVGDLAGETLRRELSSANPSPVNGSAHIDGVIDRFWDAYNAHDTQAVAALYQPDASHHEVAQGRRTQGSADIVAGLGRFLESFPDAVWTERRRIISRDDDGAAIAYRLTGHLAAPLGPFRTPGQELDLEGMFMIECAGGTITATADYWDGATFGRQMQGAA